MKLELNVYLGDTNTVRDIVADLKELLLIGKKNMADLTRLTQEVSEVSGAVDSAVVLLGQLAQLIRDNATNPAELEALAAQLDAKGTELADAVVANTPV
jgi:hypothetical protein